jgi:Leucine-rich repeat (LRR) protein
LRTLDLGHNRLRSVPDLSALSQLEILYLHDNALTALPALPSSLTYLNVSENPLPGLALPELPALIELRALELGLSSLDVSLPALRELHLRHNAFTSIPACVRELRELRLLDMRSNQLTSVPDWIVELPRLEKLDLRWNEVYDVPNALRERGCVVLYA